MSALRINLLPAYIAEVRNTKVAIGVCSAIFVAALAGTLIYYTAQQTAAVQQEEAAASMTTEATNATTALTTEKGVATALRAKIQPIKDRVAFVEQVHFYNRWVQKIYRRAAQYTNRDIEYSSMAVNLGTLQMTAYTPSVDALSRYLITFYGNPDVTAVSVTGPPGWQRPSQSTSPLEGQNPNLGHGFPFTVNATLLKSLQVPQLPASLSDSPAGATTSAPGAPGAGVPGAAPAVIQPPAPSGPSGPGGAPTGAAAAVVPGS